MTGTVVGERRYAELEQIEQVEQFIGEPQAVRRQRLPFVVVVSGAVVALSAAVIALLVPGGGSSTTVAAGGPPDPAPAAAAGGAPATFPEVGTSDVSYEPGHSSGWHVHPGVHSVVVLTGTLTVYDESCVRTDYTAGQAYLGGGTAHLAANETTERLDAVVTWVYDKASVDHGSIVLPPAGCRAA